MGRYTELIEDVPSCNILNLADIDEFLLKFGTLSTSKTAQCVDGEQSQEDRDILAKRRGQDHGRHQGEYERRASRHKDSRRRGEKGELKASDTCEDSCHTERCHYRRANHRRHGTRQHGRDRHDLDE